jgi:sortase B
MHRRNKAKLLMLAAAAVICCGVLLTSVFQIVNVLAQRQSAELEYSHLRNRIALVPSEGGEMPPGVVESGIDTGEPETDTDGTAANIGEAEPDETKPKATLWEINSDYVGWLAMPGTAIDYPVVQGTDNTKYLTTTFEGNVNPAGAIFMDCGNTDGFASQHVILYGHNMKDGGMFGSLKKYLDANFLARNPDITVMLADGSLHTYRIFSVRVTAAWDAAYRLDFADDADFAAFAEELGAPQGAIRLLSLSTCTDTGGKDKRLLVHSALIE